MAVSSAGGNGGGPNGNSQAATLADAGAGDRLVKAIWAKVLGQALPPEDKPDAFFAAVDNRYVRVIEDLYGMSRIVERPTVATGAIGGYVTSVNATRGAIADLVALKVQKCAELIGTIQALSSRGDPEVGPAICRTIASDLALLPDLLRFRDGEARARQILKDLGAPGTGGKMPIKKSRLAELVQVYSLDPAYAWTLEDTNAVTQAQHFFWVLQEISMLVSQAIPPVDLYTIAACFKRTADEIEAVRGQFVACGAPPSAIVLPIGVKNAPISFEEVLAGVEYLTSPTRIDEAGALGVTDHVKELKIALDLLGSARLKPAGKVDPADPCLPACYLQEGREIDGLWCVVEECYQQVATYKVGPPPVCEICAFTKTKGGGMLRVHGQHLHDVKDIWLVKNNEKVRATRHHASEAGDVVLAMFEEVPADLGGHQVQLDSRGGHEVPFPIDSIEGGR